MKIYFFLIIMLVSVGCTVKMQPQYAVTSLIDYNSSNCASTGYATKPDGFNSGIKITLRDKTTGEMLFGSATMTTKESGGSLGSEEYSCEEGINSESVLISAYAKNYTPLVFIFKFPKNKLAALDVFMQKSCTGGPSFFDNLNKSAQMADNRTKYTEESQDRIYTAMQDMGLRDYSFSCIEADIGRGGYIKAQGILKDRSTFDINYHWGWCSSGGSDCGWSLCFSSASNDIFESVKNESCSKISSTQSNDGQICTSEAYDKTKEVQNSCRAGEFEKADGNKKSLSIIQSTGRCNASAAVGDFNC
jgi:hypothetical protein